MSIDVLSPVVCICARPEKAIICCRTFFPTLTPEEEHTISMFHAEEADQWPGRVYRWRRTYIICIYNHKDHSKLVSCFFGHQNLNALVIRLMHLMRKRRMPEDIVVFT